MDSLTDICRVISQCRNCDLHFSRKRAVCGIGPGNARLMIVGEAPGSSEDEKGLPFVGRSGKLLDQVLSNLNLRREEIYITNSVRCRPMLGKPPKLSEIRTCSGYLRREIELVKPSLVIPMGNSALGSLGFVINRKFDRVTEIVGKVIDHGEFFIFPQFHPAAILRNPKRREYFEEYFRKASALLEDLGRMPREEIVRKYNSSRF